MKKKDKGRVSFEFANALIRLIDSRFRANTCDGIIKDVDETKFTCTVTVQETEFNEVPLRVLISSQSSFIEIPKTGTSCVMTFRDMNMTRPQILEVHECDKILMKIGSVILNITKKGFTIKNGSNSLKTIESDLLDKIIGHAHLTALGPSGPPINIDDFTNIKTKIVSFYEE
jgi:hypothetical protein